MAQSNKFEDPDKRAERLACEFEEQMEQVTAFIDKHVAFDFESRLYVEQARELKTLVSEHLRVYGATPEQGELDV